MPASSLMAACRLGAPVLSVAMLFVLFDIEVVFMYPWAVVFRDLGLFAYAEISFFLTVLGLGILYAWREGALDTIPSDAPVALVGTGLTMLDVAVELSARGRTAPLHAISARSISILVAVLSLILIIR